MSRSILGREVRDIIISVSTASKNIQRNNLSIHIPVKKMFRKDMVEASKAVLPDVLRLHKGYSLLTCTYSSNSPLPPELYSAFPNLNEGEYMCISNGTRYVGAIQAEGLSFTDIEEDKDLIIAFFKKLDAQLKLGK